MLGSAAATPGVLRTAARLSRTRSGFRVPMASSEVVMTLSLRTTASVPLVALPNIESKPARRVSPMTSVPTRKATPSSTAEKVPAKRLLWVRSEARLSRSAVRALPSAVLM